MMLKQLDIHKGGGKKRGTRPLSATCTSGSVVNNLPASTGDLDLILGSGRTPGGGNGNPLLYSCLGNPRDRGAWWATAHGLKKVRH